MTFIDSWSSETATRRASETFRRAFGHDPDGVWSAPGRVNLIGEHTDYNGGLALPIALAHRTYAAFAVTDDPRLALVSEREETVWEGALAEVEPAGSAGSATTGSSLGWAAYPAGVAWALAQEGVAVPGFRTAIASCVPYGAGLSSSAALEASVAIAIAETVGTTATGWPLPAPESDEGRAALAAACIRAENEIAGANTGGMDQAASLRARAGHALLIDCRDGAVEHLPFDLDAAGLELLVIDTRAPHALVDGQYAQRRATCEDAARTLGVATLREIAPESLEETLDRLDSDVARRRVRHVVTEIARVREFVELLRAGRLRDVGTAMDASHASLRDDYEVSCAELDVAVVAAREAGALGARMTGGGFGGSAIALVPAGTAADVASTVTRAFADAAFAEPAFLRATAAAPAGRTA